MKLTARLEGAERVRAQLLRIAAVGARALDRTVVQVEDYVEGESAKHNRTGKLVASIYKRRLGPQAWEVGHDPRVAPHATFVHWGARPHDIRPKRKKALRWPAGSAFAFARRVHHPGYKGDAWLVRAAAQAPAIFERHVRELLAQAQG